MIVILFITENYVYFIAWHGCCIFTGMKTNERNQGRPPKRSAYYHGPEKRTIERFGMDTLAVLWVPHKHDVPGERTVPAVCQNISSKGAFFVTHEKFRIGTKIGAQVSMEVKVGPKAGQEDRRVVMEIGGTVVRQEDAGVAVKFGKKYSLSRV